MFDDNLSKPVNQPANLPVEPDDMLAEVEPVSASPNALSAGLLKKKTLEEQDAERQIEINNSQASSQQYPSKDPVLGKILLVVFAGLVLAGLAWAAYWAYNNFYVQQNGQNGQGSTTLPVTTEPAPVVNAPPAETVIPDQTTQEIATTSPDTNSDMTSDSILFGAPVDTDGDGLDDTKEAELGTNSNQADTDGDGLNDGEEVMIWKTNPVMADTDGDTYSDGVEIRNGYNPLGAGKFTIPGTTATTSDK
jgi:hypothetical protein